MVALSTENASTRAAIYDGNDQLIKYSITEIFHLKDFLVSFCLKILAYFFALYREIIEKKNFFLTKQRFISMNEQMTDTE